MTTNEEINKLAGAVLGYCNHEWSDDVYAVPDFCNDLNEAQLLFKTVQDSNTIITAILESLVEDLITHQTGKSFANKWEMLTINAKTLTLACLVAIGKITLTEANDVVAQMGACE